MAEHRRGWRVAVIAAIFLAPLDAAADGIVLAPHRAAYELRLADTAPDSAIAGAIGAMTLEWERTCSGWAISQRLRVIITAQDGPRLDSEISFSSYESDDGLNYRFSSRTERNGREIEAYRGRVVRAGPGEPASAIYDMPAGGEVAIAGDVVFPMQHTRELLAAARRGEPRYFARFFDGPRPEASPFEANVIVLGDARPGDSGPGAGVFAAADRPWWNIRIAFFTADGGDEPDFELSARAQDDGIARTMSFEYGDFAMAADLVHLERLARPRCD